MLRKFFTNTENWLLIYPCILYAIGKLIFKDAIIDIHLHDTYFVLSSVFVFLFFLLVALLPFSCYKLLKRNNKLSQFSYMHVVLSNAILTFIFVLINFNNYPPSRFVDGIKFEDAFKPFTYRSTINFLAIGITTYLLLQFGFVIFTLIRIFNKAYLNK